MTAKPLNSSRKLGFLRWGQVISFGVGVWLACSVSAAPVQLVSAPSSSLPAAASAGGDSYRPIISPDGRYVLFASTANNLVLNSSNAPCVAMVPARMNVFLRDRTNGTIALVSVNLAGTGGGNGDSIPLALSTNGALALFESTASDLVTGDTNNAADLFVRDLVHGTTALVSVSTNGSCGNGPSGAGAMTPDGRFVAFSSAASNLVPGDTNGIPDIFVRDLQSGTTVLASVGAVKASGSAFTWQYGSDSPVLTPDGRYVAFLSAATNLVPGVRTMGEIYVRDLVAEQTFVVSTNAHAVVLSSPPPASYSPTISDDGRFVAFETSAGGSGFIFRYDAQTGLTDRIFSNAVPATVGYRYFRGVDMTPDGRFITFIGKPGTVAQSTNTWVYLWDSQTASATVVGLDINGIPPTNSVSDWPVIDATGRYLAFLSTATNLTTNAVSSGFHLYVRDLVQTNTILVDSGTSTTSLTKDFLNAPQLTPGGQFVAFDCTDADLVPNDSNHASDVFVCDLSSDMSELVSRRLDSLPSAAATGTSSGPVLSVSSNGYYIAFTSNAGDLVPGYTNNQRGAFVRDLLNQTNLLVSADTNGLAGADGMSAEPTISGDGRYVAFTSSADNLTMGDTNSAQDVFIRDLQSGTTSLVSVNTNASGSGNDRSYSAKLSADGRHVMFRSRATNLAAGSHSGFENLLWRDLVAGRTYNVANATISSAAMTPDGRFIAFGAAGMSLWDSQLLAVIYTHATLTLSAIAISPDGTRIAGLAGSLVYIVDRAALTNWMLVSSGPSGTISRGNLQFSGDGRFLVYTTRTPLVLGDTNLTTDVYLYDFQTGSNLLVSQSYQWPGAANGPSDSPTISSDGRYIAYRSFATDIVPNDNNGVPDVFLYDRQTAITTLLSSSGTGDFSGNSRSFSPVFSTSGATLVFESWASDLLSQDFNQNGDVFALSLYSSNAPPVLRCEILFDPTTGLPPILDWPATFGTAYQFQFKNDLSDAFWQILDGNVTVIGDRGYAADFNPHPSHRFYRVVAIY
jgi:Tol biopolymer transport system component